MAVLGFASYASAHMRMATPKPYGNPDNSPLAGDGSNFPCKNIAPDFSSATSIGLGSTQPLTFTGGATHGGGSCQISVTYDNPPTKSSVWKVITSIEGGCPTKNNPGNIGADASAPDPDTYSFSMPADIPTGKAILAWTWFNKVGNREMYMNCAAIDITAGSSKRGVEDELIARNETQLMERDQNAFNALPNMFTANIKNIGNDGCGTKEGTDTQFPNPGKVVSTPGTNSNFGPPVGTCVNGGSASSGSGSGSGSSAVAPSPSSSAAALPGGVFATVPVSSAAAATLAPVASSSPVAAAPVATSTAAAAVTSAASPAASSAPASPASPVSGAQSPGSACSTEGEWNCIGGTSFQRCASGTWSAVQQLAAGTSCTAGISATLDMKATNQKRSIRFSSEHIRRHLHARSS
jgi:hypothetical protein